MQTAKLFRNGGSQAVRLPKDCRFKGKEVFIRRIGEMVVLSPNPDPLAPLIASLDMFTEDFMTERLQGEQKDREPL